MWGREGGRLSIHIHAFLHIFSENGEVPFSRTGWVKKQPMLYYCVTVVMFFLPYLLLCFYDQLVVLKEGGWRAAQESLM